MSVIAFKRIGASEVFPVTSLSVVSRNIAREVSVCLLKSPPVAEFIQVNRRALEERALLRDTHEGIKRNRHAFGIRFGRVFRQYSVLTVFTILAVGAVQHHADAVSVADNLEAALVLEFDCLTREIRRRCSRSSWLPLAVNTNARGVFVLHEGLLALVLVGTFREVIFGIDNLHAHLVDGVVFDVVTARRKERCSNSYREG